MLPSPKEDGKKIEDLVRGNIFTYKKSGMFHYHRPKIIIVGWDFALHYLYLIRDLATLLYI